MQLFSRNKAIVALALGALALGACGDDVTVPVAPAAPTTLSITPPSATMNVGEAVNFAVQISNSASTLASCTSSSATVATATVSGSSCRVTAIGAGNATITAAASTGQSAAASVSVVAPAPAITALAVSPSAAQLAVGSSLTVVPTVNRANSTVAVVYTYTSATASVATVSATGMVTAVAPGTTTITVTAAGTGTGFAAATLTSAATITVSDRAPGLTALQVSPATAALTVGGTQAVTASAQGPRAAAATMTYGTSAPAIATVSATGVITAVAAGTATITVTAQSTQEGAFAASSMTGLVTVTVSNPAVVSINISALTQGPTTTSYLVGTTGATGIVSAVNGQSGQAIDINNTRDQIQMTATLATNGARVDSVVAYVANADGTSRTSVGSQTYPSGGSSGPVSLYINTADFTADFTAGTAAVKFANGQKRISVSAFSGATELQSTNSQTVNFNNVDGYASRLAAPARSATTAAGVIWHGGGDSTTANMGRAVIVPVFYTPSRVPASLTLAMRQTSSTATIAACGSSARNNLLSAPYAARFGGTRAATQATPTATAAIGDSTVLDCGTLESADANVIGVTGGIDNSGTALPLVTYAGGFRTSATVTAPTALKLDYVAPTTVTAIVNNPASPADPTKTWLNGSHNFGALTAISTDLGVGASPITSRVWEYLGCTTTTYAPFDGTTTAIDECVSSTSMSVYSVRYTDTDLLANSKKSAVATFGIDKTLPLISWTGAADSSVTATAGGSFAAVTYTPLVSDAKSGIDSLGVRGFVARYAAGLHSPTDGSRTNQRGCYALNAPTTAFSTAGNIAANDQLSCTAETYKKSLGTAVDGYYTLTAISTQENESMLASVTLYDRAGNKAAASTKRAMNDNGVPVFTVGLNSALSASATPSISATYADRRIASASLSLTYNSVVYRYPATVLGTAFGSTYTPTTGSIGTGTVAATPAAFTMTTTMGAPFALGVGTGASAFSPLSTITIDGLDAAGNAATAVTDAVNAGSVPVPAALTSLTTSGTFAMVASTAAAGAKVQLTGVATTTANPYNRVDIYRKVSSGVYDYLGSSVTAVTSTSTTGIPIYTWTINSYTPTNPSGAATVAVANGDELVAMGVRNNGGADLSAAAFINGASVRFTVSGLAAGSTTSVTVTGPNAFTQTVITGNATITIGVADAGVYSVNATASLTATGILYTQSAGAQTVTVVGNNVAIVTNAYAYGVVANRISVVVSGFSSNLQPVTLTLTHATEPSTQVVAYNGTNTYTVSASGTWTITAPNSVTEGTTTMLGRRRNKLAALASGTAASSTITTVSDIAASLAAGDVLVTSAGAEVAVVSAVTTTTITTVAAIAAVAASTQLYIDEKLIPTQTHTTVITTPTVTANGGTPFTTFAVNDRIETAAGILIGTATGSGSSTALTLNANSLVAVSAVALRRVRAPLTTASVSSGATANAAVEELFYQTSAAGADVNIAVTVTVPSSAGTITPSFTIIDATPTSTAFTTFSAMTSAATQTKIKSGLSGAYTIQANEALGSDGNYYGLSAVSSAVTAAAGTGGTLAVTYVPTKLTATFSGASVGDLAGYTVPVAYVGPGGTMASDNLAVQAAASTAKQVPRAGTYSVAPITAITIGDQLYSFSSGTASAVYAASAVNVAVSVTKTSAMTGAPTPSVAYASSVAASATAITITPNLAIGGAIVSGNCTSDNGTLLPATYVASTGVCTLTANATAAAGTVVNITYNVTASRAGHPNQTYNIVTTYVR